MKRSKFSLSNYKLLSCDMGKLIPCGLLEVLPGDTIQQSTSALVRLSPLLAPVMHPVHVRIHHWYVPHRLVWNNWEDFITGGPDGLNASVFPTKNITSGIGTLQDYLGIPFSATPHLFSALPFRGYQLIWNEWYRDQDLQTPAAIALTDGNDSTSTTLQDVAWEKDYFTSSRPFEQKGPSITLPLGDTAPVVSDGTLPSLQDESSDVSTLQVGASNNVQGSGSPSGWTGGDDLDWANTGLEADLSGASAITVNALREAMALQRYTEARARYGSRYTEYLRYLGVKSSDARLQRPEYLGGGRQTIQFSEVLTTAQGTSPNVVGQMRGHGIGAMRSNRYRRFFEEHGYIFSLLSVIPRTVYANGLFRTWNRRTKEDFFQKELQHIGQQEVLNKEVFAGAADPNGVFGYQDRYDEYRRQESSIAGDFKTTLNFWHQARIFASEPALNADFVRATPTDRIFAVPSADTLYVMAHHSIQARRLLAKTGKSFIY